MQINQMHGSWRFDRVVHMKIIIILIISGLTGGCLTLFLLSLAVVTNKLQRVPGFSSPVYEHNSKINLKLKNRYYSIPSDYFASIPRIQDKDRRYGIVDDLLLSGLYPNFESYNEIRTGPDNFVEQKRVFALVGVSNDQNPKERLKRLYEAEIRLTKPIEAWRITDDEKSGSLQRQWDNPGYNFIDVYLNLKDNSFTTCTREEVISEKKRLSSPRCSSYFNDQDLYFKVSYSRKYKDERDSIKVQVISKFHSWEELSNR